MHTKLFIRRLERKRTLERSHCRWEDVKMVEIRVKLTLSLTKNHNAKMYPVLT